MCPNASVVLHRRIDFTLEIQCGIFQEYLLPYLYAFSGSFLYRKMNANGEVPYQEPP